jgi:hypothetical protein
MPSLSPIISVLGSKLSKRSSMLCYQCINKYRYQHLWLAKNFW